MNILNEIVGIKKEEVKKLRQKYNTGDFMSKELYHSPTISFIQRFNASQNISVIAEIKKASPSKGIIREDFNHLKIAEDYFAAGADAVSVLTDEKFFHGSINYLKDIAAIKTAPLLRKDFIIDEVQVFEAKANGADIILLISEILSADQIKELTLAAKEAGLEVLLELHNRNQFDKIDFSANNLIGINNRSLSTFKVDLTITKEIAKYLPKEVFIVSESGITTKKDIDYLKENEDRFGFKVEEISRQDIEDNAISSTRIRKALFDGDIETANELLGYEFSITGKVVKGKQIGRTIGYPTANLKLTDKHKLIPKQGIYAVRIFHKYEYYGGMLSIGVRPTIGKNLKQTIEVNIFDFDEFIYGEHITIYFVERIRNEHHFEELNQLKNQLTLDKVNSIQILA